MCYLLNKRMDKKCKQHISCLATLQLKCYFVLYGKNMKPLTGSSIVYIHHCVYKKFTRQMNMHRSFYLYSFGSIQI